MEIGNHVKHFIFEIIYLQPIISMFFGSSKISNICMYKMITITYKDYIKRIYFK